jgi:hypothetical protein
LLYSDANGVVTTAYAPGTRSSPTNGVTVRVCYSDVDVDLSAIPPPPCTRSTTTTLTVTSEALGVSIGTNEFVETTDPSNLTYAKRYLISVVDSAGVAKPDVAVSVSLDLPYFLTGSWVVANNAWTPIVTGRCLNEDANRNGFADPGEDTRVANGRLDPGRSDAQVQLIHPRTRSDGTAEVLVTYARSFAFWSEGVLTVSASGVSGSEGRATANLQPLPFPATAIGTVTVSPPFQISPYGTAACTP